MLAIAHRAGNDIASLRHALDAGADLVEADVRYFRGVPEIRHRKILGPRLLWDHPWELVRRSRTTVPTIDEVLAVLDGDSRLMLDLKGVDPRLAPAVAHRLRHAAVAAPLAVCTRNWRMLDAFAGDHTIRLVPSAGNPRELRRLVRLLGRPAHRWPGGRRAFGVSVRRSLLTSATVAALHRAVDHVLAWPVDTPGELAEAARLGVRGVIGKDLPLLKTLSAER